MRLSPRQHLFAGVFAIQFSPRHMRGVAFTKKSHQARGVCVASVLGEFLHSTIQSAKIARSSRMYEITEGQLLLGRQLTNNSTGRKSVSRPCKDAVWQYRRTV